MTDMITPMVGTVSPVWAWVTKSTTAHMNVIMLSTNSLNEVRTATGRGNFLGSIDEVLTLSSLRNAK